MNLSFYPERIMQITLPELPAGQLNAGLVMQDGKPSHWLILLPEVPTSRLNFNDATAWAESIGGELPTRQEQSLLFANLKDQFEAALYWSGEEYKSDSGFAWYQDFSFGHKYSTHKDDELRSRAVRRLVIE
jgi:hypothetical protein